ncbi:MAG TPA: ArdC family protein, partial [Acidimicrobiia bacterium]|nr:ArdC family protein [Acidimicrobiia bacterium]
MGRTIEDLQADIEAGVGDLVAGEGWQRWLAVAATFPRYSFRNQLLILAQRPDARVVMGYRAWQALGHQVRRGEQSISILAPCTYKTKPTATGLDGDTPGDDRDVGAGPTARRVLRGFRVAHVFDIAQTDGTGVQPPQRPQLLDGEAPAGLWDTPAALVAAAGFTLTRSDLANGANGVTNFTHRTVTIAP